MCCLNYTMLWQVYLLGTNYNECITQIQVAIKCLSKEHMQNNHMEFLKEAAIMHTIDHEHIVRLYGVVLDTNALMLVSLLPGYYVVLMLFGIY